MKNFLARRMQVLFSVLGQFWRQPLTTLPTLAVLGIALALPAGLYAALANIERLSAGWERGTQISLFLKHEVTAARALRLAQEIRALPGVVTVDFISRDAALQEFKKHSGFGPALQMLGGNPLPAVLVVRPETSSSAIAIETLRARLSGLPGIDLAEVDHLWLKRLALLLELFERLAWILSALFAAAVLLIIGNTIRLAVVNRRTEIEVVELVGGTPAFIRRPFVYQGAIQGALGGLLAWILIEGGLAALSGPTSELAELYDSRFVLAGLEPLQGLLLVLIGALLGWLGSRLAVGWQLRQPLLR